MTETTEMIEMSSISVQFFGGENISRFEYIYEYIYLKLQSSIFADFKDKYLKNSFHSEIQYLHISDLIWILAAVQRGGEGVLNESPF